MSDGIIDRISAHIKAFVDIFTVQYPILGIFVGLIGLLKLARTVDGLFAVITDTLIPRGPQLSAYKTAAKTNDKNWAVITGSTGGIGEQFAHQLAAEGFNILLIGRTDSKLSKVATDITSKYPALKVNKFILDSSSATTKNYADLKKCVERLGNVSVLINNAGISHNMPTPFTEVSEAALHEIIQVNCVSTLEITRAVLPALESYTSQSRKSRALILTMGSFAGLTPSPLLSVYSGSKSFLQGWSSALAEELKPAHIDVQLIISYLVASEMSKIKRTSLLCPSPKDFVKSTLKSIGLRGGSRERAYTMTPYWSHALFHWAIESTLGVYSSIVSGINYNMHVDIRKRALRKLAKSQ